MSVPELTLSEASTAVADAGWRVILESVLAAVPVRSLRQAAEVAAAAVAACGTDADAHLTLDLRPDRVELSLQTRDQDRVVTGLTARDAELAQAVTAAVTSLGLTLLPPSGIPRPVQRLEICLDALDVAAIRPFWLAVLGFEAEPGHDTPTGAIIDPARQVPVVWFQTMDAPRPQRNRIHFDITVAHDEAPARIAAAVAAGGRVIDASAARAFWILADPEGNEICICTWQDRGR